MTAAAGGTQDLGRQYCYRCCRLHAPFHSDEQILVSTLASERRGIIRDLLSVDGSSQYQRFVCQTRCLQCVQNGSNLRIDNRLQVGIKVDVVLMRVLERDLCVGAAGLGSWFAVRRQVLVYVGWKWNTDLIKIMVSVSLGLFEQRLHHMD